jgi:hypothetical protein
MPRQGRLYGRVGDDRFDLWTPGSTRAHVVRFLGTLDLDLRPTSGTLRMVPELGAVVPLVLIVLLAIAGQFLATSLWGRLGLPLVAFLAIANFTWQAGFERREIAYRLQSEVQVTIDSP